MDVAQFKACVTCIAILDRYQVPSLSNSNGFTYLLFQYKSKFNDVFNVNPGNQSSSVTSPSRIPPYT
jgi:hypothetical protein